MLIVVAVAMLRAAMLMLVAVLMLIAMSQLQEDESADPNERAQRALDREQAGKQRNGVSMCILYIYMGMHLRASVCLQQY